MSCIKFVRGRLLVGHRRRSWITVWYSPSEDTSNGLSERNKRNTEPDGIFIGPGEVAWLSVFDDAHVESRRQPERVKIRDAQLKELHEYLSEKSESKVTKLERVIGNPGRGPRWQVIFKDAQAWRRRKRQAHRREERRRAREAQRQGVPVDTIPKRDDDWDSDDTGYESDDSAPPPPGNMGPPPRPTPSTYTSEGLNSETSRMNTPSFMDDQFDPRSPEERRAAFNSNDATSKTGYRRPRVDDDDEEDEDIFPRPRKRSRDAASSANRDIDTEPPSPDSLGSQSLNNSSNGLFVNPNDDPSSSASSSARDFGWAEQRRQRQRQSAYSASLKEKLGLQSIKHEEETQPLGDLDVLNNTANQTGKDALSSNGALDSEANSDVDDDNGHDNADGNDNPDDNDSNDEGD